ncbi:MAG TPA: heavy metal-associated domain-containing protein [Candidatus Limiplasma sp.]|nr:heavy metal-associated domain-containing protein [Candidatus Limiplasma sp.]
MEHYKVEGMSCAACSAHVDKAVRHLPFVEDVQVDLLSGAMRVKTKDGETHAQEIRMPWTTPAITRFLMK